MFLGSWMADKLLTSVGTALLLDPVINLFMRILLWGQKNMECQKPGPVFSPAGVPDCFCFLVYCSAVRWVNNALISRPFHAENWGLVPWLLRERGRVRERSHTTQAADTERVGDAPVSKPRQTRHTVDVEIPVCPI